MSTYAGSISVYDRGRTDLVLPRGVTMTTIDLNSDLAEGFGSYRCGDDTAMLAVISSANVACGFHAGDPEIMAETFRAARQRGVAIGAHPGFPDPVSYTHLTLR